MKKYSDRKYKVKGESRMRKKIVFVVIFVSIFTASITYGYFSHKYMFFPANIIERISSFANHNLLPLLPLGITQRLFPQGRWRKQRIAVRTVDSERLLTLPYMRGHKPTTKNKNVTYYDKDMTYDGLNLYVSAHAPEAFLINMEGEVVHKWNYVMKKWPNEVWRRVYLYKNGDLCANYEDYGLVKIDKNSNLIWAKKARYHHDLYVNDDGRIYILNRKERMIPRLNKSSSILEDFISELDEKGHEIRNISLLRIFEDSSYSYLMFPVDKIKSEAIDILHTNTIEVFDGRLAHISPLFKKGNILVSFFTINTIAIIDLEKEDVVWAYGPNNLIRQHDPTLLENGNILIFDNGLKFSRIIEVNPLTNKIVWEYRDNSKIGFFSATCGSNQRLPNSNTLITESDNGRAFETTLENRIVWEFINPHRTGKKSELIATLFEVIRIESDLPFLK